MFEDIRAIVGNKTVASIWEEQTPTIYYKDGRPYGLVAITDGYIIASTTRDPALPFTFGMLRDILKVNRSSEIVVITDDSRYFESVELALTRHGFECVVIRDILYSRRDRWV